jgi:uncharacterized membrane protein YqjE
METTGKLSQITAIAKRMLHRLLAISENRVELFLVEVQEERERLVRVILLAVGIAAFGLLAGVALTLAVVVLFWDHSPVVMLLALTALYGGVAGLLYRRMIMLQRDWQTLPGTLDQLRKDRECLEQNLP